MKKLTQNKFLTDDELQGLLANLQNHEGERDSIIIRMALFTGARSCEVLGIKKSHLVKDSVTIFGKKNSNDRTVPLPAPFFREVQAMVKGLEDDALIFPITTRRFRAIWGDWRPNQNLGLHSLRHTCGVKLYNNCRNIHVVKTALGHKNIQNTMCYLDFVESTEKLRQATKGMWNKKLNAIAKG